MQARPWGPTVGPRPAGGVADSHDARRIKALPMLSPAEAERKGRSLVPEMSELLRRPGSKAILKWPQALGLDYIYTHRGAYLGLPPGVGKTLITFLAPVVLHASRPCLIAPATLHRDKTPSDFGRYARDWTPHFKPATLINLESLSLDQNVHMLERGAFDLVMIDECDLLRNPESAAYKRLERYRAENPDPAKVAFVLLTGSGMRFGIEDYDLHICWALPDGAAPVPYDQEEREVWREALRAKPKGREGYVRRPRAGVLLDLCALPRLAAGELPRNELETAQAVVARRINSTPGVCIIDDDDCDQPITIRLVRAPDDPVIDADFRQFYAVGEDDTGDGGGLAYCLPNGEPCTDGLSVWRALRSLGCGYYEYIDPAPPEEWSVSRRRYARKVRTLIAASAWSSNPGDTPRAVERLYPNDSAVLDWKRIKPTFKPRTSTRLQSDSVVRYAVQWMRENRGLVWCYSVPLARWIARAAGTRYYGAEGRAADGALLDENTPGGESAVVSIKANSRGRNLQGQFHTGLVIQLPQSADECHQLFKRMHRFGQSKPVRWDVLITSGAARYSFDMALYEARQVQKVRRQTQTILRAHIEDCILDSSNPRWDRKPAPV